MPSDVVYANAITCTERNEETSEDIEREIPSMQGKQGFQGRSSVEQIEGLPEIY